MNFNFVFIFPGDLAGKVVSVREESHFTFDSPLFDKNEQNFATPDHIGTIDDETFCISH